MNTKFKFSTLLCLTFLLFSACKDAEPSEPKTDNSNAKAEIQALEDAFAAGEKAKNVDAVAAYYSDDAISYNRNEPPSVGIAAIKEKISKGFGKDSTGDFTEYKLIDLYADGDHATEIGSFTKMNAKGEKIENGYFMSYFEKRDGKYKCVRDMAMTESPEKPAI